MLNADEIKWRALDLVQMAAEAGFVITIDQVPLRPLRMGNYSTRIRLHESHRARKEREAAEHAATRPGA